MRLTLRWYRWSEVSDTLVLDRIRQGNKQALTVLIGRHHASVCSYLSTCLTDPDVVEQATHETFRQVHEAAERADLLTVNRIQLLGAARSVAIDIWRADPEGCAVTDGFRHWVTSGGSWPLEAPAALFDAYRSLPMRWQSALWHMAVDEDKPSVTAEVLGLPPGRLTITGQRARHALKDFYLAAYERSARDRPACLAHARDRAVFTTVVPGATATGHSSLCLPCAQADADLADLDLGLRLQLPAMLLGWWNDTAYQQMRALALRNSDPRPLSGSIRSA
ncbi:RNA polymerase sigma factor [Streptomyces sp. NPDC002659]|uniref:RNA polymerase sigma factor n=1 Tax=Streptomyces sp. NPDC002659 TaxID=3364656 RepID=UPI0036BF728D